jgi:hypothetical protein
MLTYIRKEISVHYVYEKVTCKDSALNVMNLEEGNGVW